MNKEHTLTKGNSPRILKYILEAETFDMEDYKLLVQNSVTNYHEYLIPLIKYKFNLEPSIELLKKGNYRWEYEISKNIKFDISLLDYYLDNPEEYTDTVLRLLIGQSSNNFKNIEDSVLQRIFDMEYYLTLDTLLIKHKCVINEEYMKKINSIKTNKPFRFDEWQCKFDTSKAFCIYFKMINKLSNTIIQMNLDLFNNEDIHEYIKECKKNKIKIESFDLKRLLTNKNKQIIKLFFAIGYIYLSEKNIRIINSNKDLWKYINFENIYYSYNYRQVNIKKYNIEEEYDKLLEDIYKTVWNIKNNFKNYNMNEPLLIINILLEQITIDKKKIENIRNILNAGKVVANCKDIENFINEFNILIDKYVGKVGKINIELPIITE